MPLSKQEEFFVPEFCDEQVSIATTEFSNHPDQASVDEELKNKDQDGFVKPLPIKKTKKNVEENREKSEEVESSKDESEGEESSEFEQLEPEN